MEFWGSDIPQGWGSPGESRDLGGLNREGWGVQGVGT